MQKKKKKQKGEKTAVIKIKKNKNQNGRMKRTIYILPLPLAYVQNTSHKHTYTSNQKKHHAKMILFFCVILLTFRFFRLAFCIRDLSLPQSTTLTHTSKAGEQQKIIKNSGNISDRHKCKWLMEQIFLSTILFLFCSRVAPIVQWCYTHYTSIKCHNHIIHDVY